MKGWSTMNKSTLKAIKARLDKLLLHTVTIGKYDYWLRMKSTVDGNWNTDIYTVYRMSEDARISGSIEGYAYCTQDDINNI
jgi:hypothetical protein